MQVTTKKLSDTKIEVTVKLGAEELADAKLVALNKLAKSAKVPGFREGKAPASVVEKHVDQNTLASETLENAVSKAVAKAFMDEDIHALNQPQIEVTKFVPNQLAEFTATSDIFPQVKLGDYKNLKARLSKLAVTDQEVADVLTNLQNSFADKKEVNRAVKNGDEAVIDFVGKKDGKEFEGGKGKDYPLVIGSNSFIPGFENGVVGHKAGDKFELKITFPKDYQVKTLAGNPAVFEVTLHKVNEIIKPALNDELAAKAGPFKTLGELKQDIKTNLLERKKYEATEKLKDDLVLELADKSSVPLPEILVDDQTQNIKHEMDQNLAYRGMTLQNYLESIGKTEDEWLKTDVKTAAENRVKIGLTLAELSKELKLDVTDSELAAQMDELRLHYKDNKAVLEQLEADGAKFDIRNHLLTEKTIAQLMKINKLG
ncbi:trigger factor [Candidatus Saccharibacteria bacterium]|nr:trigger factor [Candidatus Saccharibacteria bacterium]